MNQKSTVNFNIVKIPKIFHFVWVVDPQKGVREPTQYPDQIEMLEKTMHTVEALKRDDPAYRVMLWTNHKEKLPETCRWA